METNAVASFRNRQSPSSERLLGLSSQPQPEKADGDNAVNSAKDELDEDDVFWTGDFSESRHVSSHSSNKTNRGHYSMSFRRSDNSGILVALTEEDKKRSLGERAVLCRKTSISSCSSSSSRMIPKSQTPHEREYSLSLPSAKFHQSAPVNVPAMSKAVAGAKDRNPTVSQVSDEDFDNEMLPPHEIVSRRSGRSAMTFSVLEGVGRTLKGRDLRQVRNAVWRKTGFLD